MRRWIIASMVGALPLLAQDPTGSTVDDRVAQAWRARTVPTDAPVLEAFARLVIERTMIPAIREAFGLEPPQTPYRVIVLGEAEFARTLKPGNTDAEEEKILRSYQLLGAAAEPSPIGTGYHANARMYFAAQASDARPSIPVNSIVLPTHIRGEPWEYNAFLKTLAHEIMHYFQFQSPTLKDTPLIAAQREGKFADADARLAAEAVIEGQAELVPAIFNYVNEPNRERLIADDYERSVADYKEAECGKTPAAYLDGFPYVFGARYMFDRRRQIAESFRAFPKTTEEILAPTDVLGFGKAEEIPASFFGGGVHGALTFTIGHAFARYVFCRQGLTAYESAARGWDGIRVWLTAGDALVWWSSWDTESDALDVEQQWSAATGPVYKRIVRKGRKVLAVLGDFGDETEVDRQLEAIRAKLDE